MTKHSAKSHHHNINMKRIQLSIIGFILLIIFSFIFLISNNQPSLKSKTQTLVDSSSSVKLNPVVDFWNNTEVMWQIPSSPPKAALFLAHGCNGRAGNFWDPSVNCPKCVGLPEERQLVIDALSREFAVIAISSAGQCWTLGEEIVIVKEIIRWWLVRNYLEKVPLFALGASSGGYFVSALAPDLSFSSITIMIAEGVFDRLDISDHYPPTLFVHMPKDKRRQRKISQYMQVFKEKGVDVAEIECKEMPLSPTYLADRVPGLDRGVSAKLFELFQNKGFVDENGYLVNDGRAIRWKEAVRKSNDISLDEKLVHQVEEELNLAYAYHEMTSVQSEQIFKWFENHMK